MWSKLPLLDPNPAGQDAPFAWQWLRNVKPNRMKFVARHPLDGEEGVGKGKPKPHAEIGRPKDVLTCQQCKAEGHCLLPAS